MTINVLKIKNKKSWEIISFRKTNGTFWVRFLRRQQKDGRQGIKKIIDCLKILAVKNNS